MSTESQSLQSLREVAAFLDSVKPLYPGGVPLSLRGKSSNSATNCKVIFLVDSEEVTAQQEKLSGPCCELLASIIEKGVKLQSGEYFVMEVTQAQVQSERLQEQIALHHPLAIISFGVLPGASLDIQPAQGKLLQILGVNFLLTIPLKAAHDQTGKRTLWSDLKQVLSSLLKE